MNEARKTFSLLAKGILNIIRSADLYQLHLLAKRAGTEPDKILIESIMGGSKISGQNVSSQFYQKEDFEFLKKNADMKEIGQQILLSVYTAVEMYLIDKFKEYYRHKTTSCEERVVEESIKRFSFRSLDEIKKNYSKTLNIHIPYFDIEFYSDNESNFQPKTSWEALLILSKARNEIAHTGKTKELEINSLLDIWHPFDFARRWVRMFDSSFDLFIYKGSDKFLRDNYLLNLPRKV